MLGGSRDHPDEAWIEAVRGRFQVERLVDEAFVRKLRLRNDGPHRRVTVDEAKAQLECFSTQIGLGRSAVEGVRGLTGGTSKEQFAFDLIDGDVRRRLVLRMQPKQSLVETHRLREAQVLQAIKDVVPVPEVFAVDAQAEIFSQPALVYAFCDGIARPPASDHMGSVRAGFDAEWRQALAPQFIAHLAAIHTFDPDGYDLSAFDIPANASKRGILAGIDMWERAWEEDRLEAIPLMTLAARWLRENAPVIDRVSLVHCDYRPGNFLFSAETRRITAILDWELARFGDRHEDLATVLMPGLGEYDEDGRFLVCGLCTRDEFINRYQQASGLVVDPDRLAYYEIYNHFRVVAMSLGGAGRCLVGQTTHQDIILSVPVAIAGMALGQLGDALKEVLAHVA